MTSLDNQSPEGDDEFADYVRPLPSNISSKPWTSTPWKAETTPKNSRIDTTDDSGYLSIATSSCKCQSFDSCKDDSCAHQSSPLCNRVKESIKTKRCKDRTRLLFGCGWEIGETHVDFLSELRGKWRQCIPAVTEILRYLSAKDLTTACCVSKSWRKICLEDSHARRRRAAFVKELTQSKKSGACEHDVFDSLYYDQENRTTQKKCAEKDDKLNVLVPGVVRAVGNNIGNLINGKESTEFVMPTHQKSPVKNLISRHELFQQEAAKLSTDHEILQSCPRCTSPAIIDLRIQQGECTKVSCKHTFCAKCQCSKINHETNACVWKQRNINSGRKKNIVGSKNSKRNLKRL